MTVRDTPTGAGGQGSLVLSVGHAGGQRVVRFGDKSVNVSHASAEVSLEAFVDGPVVELFVNGGERALTTNSGNPAAISDTKISFSATGVAPTVSVQVWGMAKSVAGPA